MLNSRKLGIGCDHAGFEMKNVLLQSFTDSINFVDYGCFSSESVDYPDYAHALCRAIVAKEIDMGILLCGSGNGINITANKYQEIRSALCWMPEIAELARLHNNANVLALPARFISTESAIECVKVFISSKFEGGRHLTRVNKIRIS